MHLPELDLCASEHKRAFERFLQLDRIVDREGQSPLTGKVSQSRCERPVQLANDVFWNALIVDQRQPDFPPGFGPHADELAAHS
jgi:hypothetical protein